MSAVLAYAALILTAAALWCLLDGAAVMECLTVIAAAGVLTALAHLPWRRP